jgi:hypothetical protein
MIRHRDSFPARLARAVAVGIAVLARPVGAAEPDVLVWPRTPTTAVDGVDAALRSAGRRPRDFAPLRARLLAEDEAERAAARAALAAVERELAAARQAFLAQRYDDMLAALARAESGAAAALPPGPQCASALWEIEFQLGLAHLARNSPGDPERARARFLLALALDPERRPVAALYGPDVALAFVQAVDEAARRPPRPVRLALAPADAALAVDCRPLPEAPSLRPGLHLVRVAAPGHAPDARITPVADELRATLSPDPAAPLGPWWVRGALDPASASARAAVQALAGAADVVWLEQDDGRHVARRIAGAQPRRVARADTAADAAVQALAADRPPARPAPPARRRTALLLGLGLGGAALTGLALGLGLGLREPTAHLQLVVR